MQGVNQLGPDVNIDGGGVVDELEALLEPILKQGESHKKWVKETEHDNQLKIEKIIFKFNQ